MLAAAWFWCARLDSNQRPFESEQNVSYPTELLNPTDDVVGLSYKYSLEYSW